MALTDLECPNCGANDMAQDDEQRLFCLFCGSSFGEVTRICPRCGHYNEAGARHCLVCGTLATRDCPTCGADNWILAEHCVQCGRNLDLIEQVTRRWQRTVQQRLYDRQAEMISLKEREERASQERMASLMEAERIRQEALVLARESQRQRDRQVYLVIGIAFLAFFLVAVAVLLLSSLGG